MADAPAADATNDANADDAKNKLKKKKNEPEKKEKLVIHGRKDEDILGSAYVKKYRRDDPTDWSRYADNPRGMLNRRRLTREERRRQFTVQNVVRACVETNQSSRRWRGAHTPSSRRDHGDNVASIAWDARNLISHR